MTDVLQLRVEEGVATLTLHRPERRNAMDEALAEAVLRTLERVSDDDAVRCVVLRGAGGHFSVGGDLEAGAGGITGDTPTPQIVTGLRMAMRSSQLLHEMPKPTIAAIRGACAGAGLSWACACDLRYASDTARFNTAFAQAGVSGDFGGTWTLPRIVGPAKARELYLLAEKFGADEAHRIGLVSAVWPDDGFEERVHEVARKLAGMAPLALAAVKANLNDSARLSFSEQLDREAQRHATTARTEDAVEAAMAFLQKRTPRFQGR